MSTQILDIIDNPNIYLRPIELDDIQPLYDLIVDNREHLKTYQPWALDATLESTKQRIKLNIERIRNNEFRQFRIISKKYNKYAGIVGTVTFHNKQKHIKATLMGYWVCKDVQGLGYAYEASNRAIEYAFQDWDMDYVILEIEPGNKRSEHLAKRLGAWSSEEFSALDGDGQQYRSKIWVITNEQ